MERRLHRPLEEWTIDDVEALISERIPEGQRLDYKQALSLDRDKDRIELAKDASGLGNAQGGLIIYGVAEDDSDEPRPERITPLPRAGQQTRMEDILDNAVQPRLEFQIRTLDARDGSVILLRVAPRVGGPHMVQAYKQHRFFIRRGTRTVPMGEDEVRNAYESARRRADSFAERLRELPLLPRLFRPRSADTLMLAASGHAIPEEFQPLVSVVSAPLDAPRELLPVQHIQPAAFPEPYDRYLGNNRRLSGRGAFEVDAWGLIDEVVRDHDDNDDPNAPKVVVNHLRVYRQGVLTWSHRYAVPDPQAIPTTAFAWDVHNAFMYFASIYDTIGYAGRIAVFVHIDNADSAWLSLNERLAPVQRRTPTGMESITAEHQTTVDALLADPTPALRDTMQRIWQAFGYPTCLLFDRSGNWAQFR